MPSLKVQQPSSGYRPSINEDAARIMDLEGNKLFLYGGVRMRKNRDCDSPTTLPTADFYSCDLILMQWVKHKIPHTQWPHNPLRPGPGGPVHPLQFRIPRTNDLPILQDPIGAVLRDRQRHSLYILILGDLVDSEDNQDQGPVLICINFTLGNWMEIPLRKSRNIEGGRGRAAMVILGEIGGPFLRLFVFGGIDNFNYYDKPTCRKTIAVADLRRGAWIQDPTFVHVPPEVGSFGARPAAISVLDPFARKEKIVIINGNNFQDSNLQRRSAYLFDPDNGHFERLDFDGHSFPVFDGTDTDEIIVQRTSPHTEERNTFLLFAWNRRRLRGGKSYEATTHISTLLMRVRFVQNNRTSARLSGGKPRERSLRLLTHLPSPLSSRVVSPTTLDVEVDILLEKLSFGRSTGQAMFGTHLFDTPFAVETACVRRKITETRDFTSGEGVRTYENIKVVMLGYSPHEDFIGDIRLKCFNAFSMVAPKALLEELATDDELDDLHHEILESDGRATSQSGSEGESDTSMDDTPNSKVIDGGDDESTTSDEEETGSSSSDDANEDGRQTDEVLPNHEPQFALEDPHFDINIANMEMDDAFLSSPQLAHEPEMDCNMMLEPFDNDYGGLDEFLNLNTDFMTNSASEMDLDTSET